MDKAENQIVVYQPDETIRLDVRLENETVWLNRHQMAQLFGRDVKTIGKHIANALSEELAEGPLVANLATTQTTSSSTVAKFATVQHEGGREVVRRWMRARFAASRKRRSPHLDFPFSLCYSILTNFRRGVCRATTNGGTD